MTTDGATISVTPSPGGGSGEPLSRIVARNSSIGLAAQMAIKVLAFGFSVLVIRQLGAQTYGQYAAVLAFGGVFVVFADLGLGVYTVRQVALFRNDANGATLIGDLYANILGLRLILSIVTALALIGSAWLTGRPPMFVGAIALGSIGLVMYSVQGAGVALLAGHERFDLTAGSQVVYQLVFVAVGTGALVLRTGYDGLIVANLVGIAAITVICWTAARRLGVRPGRPSPKTWPFLLRAGVPFAVIGFSLGLSYKFDSVLLNIYRGDAETGYYNAAYNLVFSAVVLSNVFNTSLYPSMTRQAATDPTALPPTYERALGYLMVIALPLTIGTWAIADRLVPFLFTASYLPAVPALRIVIWVTPLMFASEFLGYVVLVRGDERRAARAIVASTGLNVALNLVLIPRFGLLGASAMTVATEVVLVGQYIWILRDLVGRMDPGRTLGRPVLAAGLMAVALWLLRDQVLPLQVAAGAVVYGGLLVVLGVIGKEEWEFVRPSIRKGGEGGEGIEGASPQ